MRTLTSLDAQFLALEDGRAHGHVAALGLYDPTDCDGGALSLAAVRPLVAERLPLLEPWRWRLADAPLGIGLPSWVEDDHIDLDAHLGEVALPAPGSRRQLADAVARLISQPLDRSRPLWELHLIRGLRDGRVAVLTKIHHALADGLAGGEMLAILCGMDPLGAPATDTDDASAGERTGERRSLGALAGAATFPLRAARAAVRVLPHLDQVVALRSFPAASRIAGARRLLPGSEPPRVTRSAPPTPFNLAIGPDRRFAFTSVPLADLAPARAAAQATVTDLVASLCAGALRRALIDRDALPDEPLLAMVPVSVRTAEEAGTFGNRVSSMVADLPTTADDAATRLAEARTALGAAKTRFAATPPTLAQDAADLVPPALLPATIRIANELATSRLSAPPVNVVVSSVRAPSTTFALAGARLEAQFPASMIIDGVGVNITVLGTRERLDFGIVADAGLDLDPWELVDALNEEAIELARAYPAEVAQVADEGLSRRGA